MFGPIVECAVCGSVMPLEDAKTDSDGRAVHEDCRLPDYVAISPISLTCPRCHAEPGAACEVLDEDLEIVHVERIELATEMDGPAKSTSRLDAESIQAIRVERCSMLSPGEIAVIRAEIKRLEQALAECRDGGIRKVIEGWIEDQKEKLNDK
jgi:hypothetical protein